MPRYPPVRWSAVTTPSTMTVSPTIGLTSPVPCTSAIVVVASAAWAGTMTTAVSVNAPAAAVTRRTRRPCLCVVNGSPSVVGSRCSAAGHHAGTDQPPPEAR